MPSPNCVTVAGLYGEFQLCDPMDRKPSGYVTMLLSTDSIVDGERASYQVYFHFFMMHVVNFDVHRADFERDLLNLIKTFFPQFANWPSESIGSVYYTDPKLK